MLQFWKHKQNHYLDMIKFAWVSGIRLKLIIHKKEFYVICERLKNRFFFGSKACINNI